MQKCKNKWNQIGFNSSADQKGKEESKIYFYNQALAPVAFQMVAAKQQSSKGVL